MEERPDLPLPPVQLVAERAGVVVVMVAEVAVRGGDAHRQREGGRAQVVRRLATLRRHCWGRVGRRGRGSVDEPLLNKVIHIQVSAWGGYR